MLNALKIQAFDPRNAQEHEYAAANRMENRMRAEREPDDPPVTLEEDIQRWRNIPPFIDVKAWGVWNEDRSELIASASVAVLHVEQNQHLAEVEIEVLPEYRRRGLARRLLALCVDVARQENRRLMMSATTSIAPAGEAFVRHIGGELGLAMHTNQLLLADLDRDLVRRWLERGEQNRADFELLFWDGAYPASEVDVMADFLEVNNTQPRENLDMEDWHITSEHLREFERSMAAQGLRRWTMVLRERGSGKFVGYTEITWHPNRPHILEQGGTSVVEAYRKRGLGRWLKAAMLDKITRELPDAKFVRTGNAFSNAPMLKINDELGFKPYRTRYQWQVETQKALNYLGARQHERAYDQSTAD